MGLLRDDEAAGHNRHSRCAPIAFEDNICVLVEGVISTCQGTLLHDASLVHEEVEAVGRGRSQ